MSGVKRYPVVLFFVLAFLLPWSVWMTSVAQAHGWMAFHVPQALAFWLGLTIATALAAALSGGKAALRDVGARIVRWRVAPLWYAIAVGLPILLGVICFALDKMAGHSVQVGKDLSLRLLIPVFLLEWWLFLLTEEAAWRGFALPRLQRRYSPLYASLILGVLWGLWHIPLFLIPDSFQSTLPFVGFLVSTVATSIMISWIFNHARGSVLVCALFHAVTDVSIAYLGVMSSGNTAFWLFVIVQCAVAGGLVASKPSEWRQLTRQGSELVYSGPETVEEPSVTGDFGLPDALAGERA